ncbi:hypothetical protein [Alienimonas californiensis]|uniref:Uncharacterized protein n=1 Tax=Alienimonas californiensis TaxID=2527989 RepID=A0A517P6S9_9PLAN|nr:hypothetical protein [Alienimonas californiensis]QDT15052.1 hypothetical protein CA12_11320 [Alienimonas californiensis]
MRVWHQYDPAAGLPGAWAARVAENRVRDLERAERRRRARDRRAAASGPDAADPGPDAFTPLAGALDGEAPAFSPDDVARLNAEDVLSRVLIAAAYGLWRVAPAGFTGPGGDWFAWLDELGAVDPAAVDDALLAADTSRERVAIVADVAGLVDNSVFQRFRRSRHRVVRLDYWWNVALPHVDHHDVFTGDDLARLRAVGGEPVEADGPPADRLVLLCLGGAWNRFETRSDFEEVCRPNVLRKNFPWLTFLEERSFAARLRALSGRDALHRPAEEVRGLWRKTKDDRSALAVRGRRDSGETDE